MIEIGFLCKFLAFSVAINTSWPALREGSFSKQCNELVLIPSVSSFHSITDILASLQ